MRLIFDEEREFLKRVLDLEIPKDSAFMNKMCIKMINSKGKWQTIYRLHCKNEKLEINNDSSKRLKEMKFKTWWELIEENKDYLLQLEENSIEIIKKYSKIYENYTMSVPVSGGKDSAIVHHLVNKVIKNEETIFSNTTNETHHTYKYIKKYYPDAKIITPAEGFYQFVERTGFIPTRFGRACCTNQKELPMIQQLDKNSKRVFFMGMRKDESKNRSKYEIEWKNNRWGNREWQGVLPILEWSDMDVLLYMLFRKIPFNQIYKFGFNRCGCTNCCFRSDYELLLNKEFLRTYYDRWQLILEKDFIDNKKAPVLNCTLNEYKKGAWKAGVVRDKATNDIIKEFAAHQKLNINIAKKYFDKKCVCCNKKLKKDDIALSMKYYGRYIEQFKCYKCLADDLKVKPSILKNKVKEFKNQGCTLF